MKTIGLLGGMSWESSLEYYRLINEYIRKKLGGLHSAQSLLYSFDFHDVETLQASGQWDEATNLMLTGALSLQDGGADFIVICTNTMHKTVPILQLALDIPILHIAQPTARRIKEAGIKTVGLLGTAYTMEHDFYKTVLIEAGLEVLIPSDHHRQLVHDIIYDELVIGQIDNNSRRIYQSVIRQLWMNGAEGVILGCTEIGLLIKPKDSIIPTFDTTQIHAEAAVDYALGEIDFFASQK